MKSLKSLVKKASKAIATAGMIGALTLLPAKKANSNSVLNVPLTNSSGVTDFQASCSYLDSGLGCLVEFIGSNPNNSDLEGNKYNIYGLFYGDENNMTLPDYWTNSTEVNSDNSENFNFSTTNYYGNINYWNPQSFGIYWDSNAPSGIGSMDLDSYLMMSVKNAYNDTFTGWAPAPSAIASQLEQFQPPVVPEPVSSVLFAVGGGILGSNYLRRKLRDKKRK